MPVRPGSLYPLAVFLIASLVIAGVPLVAAELQVIEGCTLVPADWADGDSFRVRLPAGEEITVRLYGADCLEQKVTDETDARRLRSQRRYFGITRVKPEAATAIAFAKDLGRQGTDETRAFLARPFTIHTSFADARGDARFKRVYAFVFDADGRDLAAHLVAKGLARAYGVSRSTVAGESADDYREMLAKEKPLESAGIAETIPDHVGNLAEAEGGADEAIAAARAAIEEAEGLDLTLWEARILEAEEAQAIGDYSLARGHADGILREVKNKLQVGAVCTEFLWSLWCHVQMKVR